MTADDTDLIQWRVYAKDWRGFEERAGELESRVNDYLKRYHLHQAIDEYADEDAAAEVEEIIDEYVRAAGRRPADVTEKKISVNQASSKRGETKQISRNIDVARRDALKRIAAETDRDEGKVLSDALYEYRHGGRAARMKDKLQRIDGPITEVLSAMSDDGDDGGSSGLNAVERRTFSIAGRLNRGGFNRDELHDAIEAEGITSKQPTEEYVDRVLDRLDCVLHPNPDTTDVYIPIEQARDLADRLGWPSPDAPAIDRLPYSHLSDDQKIEGVRITVARQAERSTGDTAALPVDAIQRQVFDGRGSTRHIKRITEDAAEATGFTCSVSSTSGKQLLKADASAVDAAYLRSEPANDEQDQGDETDVPAPAEADEQGSDTDDERADAEAEGASMDELLAAEPVRTDGGRGGDRE